MMNQLALELDINSAVDNIRDVVLELLHCERVTLFLVDNQQKELRYMTSPVLHKLHCNSNPTCCKASHICCIARLQRHCTAHPSVSKYGQTHVATSTCSSCSLSTICKQIYLMQLKFCRPSHARSIKTVAPSPVMQCT